MFGELNNQETENVLTSQLIGRIGCHAHNKTYVVPISYVYDGNYIYSHTNEGMKITMMRENPEVCFEVDNFENMANWQSVICWGKFEELTNTAERTEAIKKLVARNVPVVASSTVKLFEEFPYFPGDVSKLGGIVFRIRIETKSGRFEKQEYGVNS